MTLIIPYTTEQLNWHLSNNVEPMNLDEEIVTGANVTVAQMLDDLHIAITIFKDGLGLKS